MKRSAILAHAGEGSVRDSLSALDQAIACCGNMLNADEVRALLGLFSLESLQEVADALLGGNSQRMLEVVQELERNGQNLQHFCRELSRYFRNLLVSRICRSRRRKLIAASPAEQARDARDRRNSLAKKISPATCSCRSICLRICRLRCSRDCTWKWVCFAWCRPAGCCRSNRRSSV